MLVGLVPLDERPVNTRYPAMIARIAGVELELPPPDLLSDLREPAPCDMLAEWLRDLVGDLDALVISLEMLGYGGLIASRISDEPTGAIIERLELLYEIKQARPELPVFGFSVITRVSNADVAVEEPTYWDQYGTRLYRYSQLLDRRSQGQAVADDLSALEATIPAEYRQDFLQRRLRNHSVNQAGLQLLADGALDLLVLSSDDTSPYGLPSREKRWLAEWADWLDVGSRLLMYPGADEVGCVLLARIINQQSGRQPRFEPFYAVSGGEQIVAPYEDGPIQLTVERQIEAVGGAIGGQDSQFWLAVNPPVERRAEWCQEHAERERRERLPQLRALARQIHERQPAGQQVIVADVAYPNGADPVLIEQLRKQVDLTRLAAYGAWNTAGNTIGTALAQGCATLCIVGAKQRHAHELFLLHRFIEDWGYQQGVRADVREWLRTRHGQHEPDESRLAETCAWIEERLNAMISRLPGYAERYRIAPGSVRLPWRRTFEVDFELQPLEGQGEA